MSFCLRSSHQRLCLMRSCRRCRFTVTNSPESTLRTYRFCVYGSKDSLFPRICAVLAVGIGATRREFRRPCSTILAFNPVQSQRPDFGATFQKSNCNLPLLAGEPLNVS